MALLASTISFDPKSHTYTLRNGEEIPSVTTVLDEMGLMPKFYSDAEFYRARGSAVHKATQLLDEGKLGRVDDRISGFIEAWKQFKYHSGAEMLMAERLMHCATHRYAGTVDRLCVIKGKKVVIDLKCGEPAAAAALQTAAYARLLESHEGIKPEGRLAVRLKEDGTYKAVEHNDPQDDRMFLYALSLYKWKKAKKIR